MSRIGESGRDWGSDTGPTNKKILIVSPMIIIISAVRKIFIGFIDQV